MAFFAFSALLPFTADASIISSITDSVLNNFVYVDKYEQDLINSKYNSQTMDILSVDYDFDENLAKGGGDVEISDGVALISNDIFYDEDSHKTTKNNGKISIYEVREGDTLSQIADMFGVSESTIRWANNFDGPIKPGQSLVILPVTGVKHVVKNGGTLKDIADLYGAEVLEIARFNGIDVDKKLNKGDEIIVPNVDPVKTNKNNSVKYAGKTDVSKSYFGNPIPGGIITQALHGYNGIDIGVPYGTPVYAAAAGKVITSKEDGWNGGYGGYIIISHSNGTQTLYSHNSSNAVSVGEYVEKGQVIGYVGSTGKSTGNHLHFEVRGAKNPLSACKVGSRCYID